MSNFLDLIYFMILGATKYSETGWVNRYALCTGSRNGQQCWRMWKMSSAPRAGEVSSSPMFYRMVHRIIESKCRCSLRAREYSHPEQRSGLNSLWNTISLRTGIFSGRTKRERERKRESPADLGDIKEVMSRTRDGRKYAGLPPAWAKFFEKFEIDRSLDKDARSRVATSYKQAHNFSKLFAKWHGTFKTKFTVMTDDVCQFAYFLLLHYAPLLLSFFLFSRRDEKV